MRLSAAALAKINSIRIRLALAVALDVTEQTIIRYIQVNHENLTKVASLKVIKEYTGLTEDEILEIEPSSKS